MRMNPLVALLAFVSGCSGPGAQGHSGPCADGEVFSFDRALVENPPTILKVATAFSEQAAQLEMATDPDTGALVYQHAVGMFQINAPFIGPDGVIEVPPGFWEELDATKNQKIAVNHLDEDSAYLESIVELGFYNPDNPVHAALLAQYAARLDGDCSATREVEGLAPHADDLIALAGVAGSGVADAGVISDAFNGSDAQVPGDAQVVVADARVVQDAQVDPPRDAPVDAPADARPIADAAVMPVDAPKPKQKCTAVCYLAYQSAVNKVAEIKKGDPMAFYSESYGQRLLTETRRDHTGTMDAIGAKREGTARVVCEFKGECKNQACYASGSDVAALNVVTRGAQVNSGGLLLRHSGWAQGTVAARIRHWQTQTEERVQKTSEAATTNAKITCDGEKLEQAAEACDGLLVGSITWKCIKGAAKACSFQEGHQTSYQTTSDSIRSDTSDVRIEFNGAARNSISVGSKVIESDLHVKAVPDYTNWGGGYMKAEASATSTVTLEVRLNSVSVATDPDTISCTKGSPDLLRLVLSPTQPYNDVPPEGSKCGAGKIASEMACSGKMLGDKCELPTRPGGPMLKGACFKSTVKDENCMCSSRTPPLALP